MVDLRSAPLLVAYVTLGFEWYWLATETVLLRGKESETGLGSFGHGRKSLTRSQKCKVWQVLMNLLHVLPSGIAVVSTSFHEVFTYVLKRFELFSL